MKINEDIPKTTNDKIEIITTQQLEKFKFKNIDIETINKITNELKSTVNKNETYNSMVIIYY